MKARFGQLLARLRTPVGCAAVLCAVIADVALMAWLFPRSKPAPSIMRGLVYRDFRGSGNEFVASFCIVREPDGGRTIIDESQSAGRFAELSQREPSRIISVSYWRGSWFLGIIAPWERREVSRVMVWEMATGEEPTDVNDAALARRAMSDWLAAQGQPEYSRAIEEGDFNTSATVWWGPPHDLAVFTAVVVVISCLPLVPRWVRDRGVRARLSRGVCPACRYDLRAAGEKVGRVLCPECGQTWDAAMLRRDATEVQG